MNDLSGYGEVKLGDKTLPLKFGANAYRLFCQNRNIELYQLDETFRDPFAVVELAYFAHVTAMRMRNEITEVGIDAFVEMVGDTTDVIPQFEKLVETSRVWGLPMADIMKKKSPDKVG